MKKTNSPWLDQPFKRSLLAVAVAATSIGSVNLFAEEDAADDDVEEVIVTGIRGSLQAAQDLKSNSSTVVEAITAEDIGKLPDVSIAESLGRLPGLAAQRLNGRAQVISIRGLDPDFQVGTLNGRMQVSSGDNRSIEFDQYPSELLNAVVVHKTPTASMIQSGISGTIDLQTIRPLDHGERTIATNIRYEQNEWAALNSDQENSGERATFSYIDQFADDTIGVALGLSHTNTPTQGQRFNAWGYPDAASDGSQVIGGAKPFVQSNALERLSLVGVLQYEPNDQFSSTIDLFVSDFNEDQLLRGIEIPLAWSSASLQPGFVSENGIVTSGTFDGVRGVMRNDIESRETEMMSIGGNFEFKASDTLTLVADFGYSKADRVDQILENYSGIDLDDSMSFSVNDRGVRFTSNTIGSGYADSDLVKITSPQGWGGDFVNGGQKGYYKQPAIEDEIQQLKFAAQQAVELGPINMIDVGVAYDTRTKSKTTSPQYYFGLSDTTVQAVDLPSNTSTTDLSFLGLGNMVSYDPLAIFNSDLYERVPGLRADIASQNYTIEEEVVTAYVQADIDYEVAGMPLVGNVGLQIVDTDQSSTGISASGRNQPVDVCTAADPSIDPAECNRLTTTEVSGGLKYTNVLPSLNLSLEVTEDLMVRLGAAKTLTRPRMDDMRASRDVSLSANAQDLISTDVENSPWSSSGGNPELKPWLANAFDISVENYFDEAGYVAFAVFHKDLESYIVSGRDVADFTGLDTFGLNPLISEGYNNYVTNGEGGFIQGYEFSFSLTGEMAHDALEGFGLVGSSTYTRSSIEPEGTPEQQMPGLSPHVHSLTAYFEKNGFSARVNSTYRSAFVGELAGFDAQRTQRIVMEENLISAQLGYEVQSGDLQGLSVTLQANNLNNEPFITTDGGNEDLILDYQDYGRTYALGVSYKF